MNTDSLEWKEPSVLKEFARKSDEDAGVVKDKIKDANDKDNIDNYKLKIEELELENKKLKTRLRMMSLN